jgi:hypothetical protein
MPFVRDTMDNVGRWGNVPQGGAHKWKALRAMRSQGGELYYLMRSRSGEFRAVPWKRLSNFY